MDNSRYVWDTGQITFTPPPTAKRSLRALLLERRNAATVQAAADADNLYSIGRSHHVSQGRHFAHGAPIQNRDWQDWTEDEWVRNPDGSFAGKAGGSFPNTHVAAVTTMTDGTAGYMKANGMGAPADVNYNAIRADPVTGKAIADLYEAAPMDDPAAHAAYEQLGKETAAQYDYLTNTMGVKVDVTPTDPYPSVKEMAADLRDNNHISVLSTATTGGHPYFTNEQNDQFRAVHDAFGHAGTGRGFDRNGEAAAWTKHMEMYSPLAGRALTSETRAQNSAMVFGSNHDFPQQKVFLLPTEYSTVEKRESRYSDDQPRDADGKFASGAQLKAEDIAANAKTDAADKLSDLKPTLGPAPLLTDVHAIEKAYVDGTANLAPLAIDPDSRRSSQDQAASLMKAAVASDVAATFLATNGTKFDYAMLNTEGGLGVNVTNAWEPDPSDPTSATGTGFFGLEQAMTADNYVCRTEGGGASLEPVTGSSRNGNEDITQYLEDAPGHVLVGTTSYNAHDPTDPQVDPTLAADPRSTIQIARADTPEALQLMREATVNTIVGQWAVTSNDHDPNSLALQDAVAKEFGLTGTASWDAGDPKDPSSDAAQAQWITDHSGPMYQAVMRAQYDTTQQFFKDVGVTSLTLYRGEHTDTAPPGVGAQQDVTEHSLRPLSSWATSASQGEDFADKADQYGVTYRADVPVDRILSTPRTGNGCLAESEMTVLGGTDKVAATLIHVPDAKNNTNESDPTGFYTAVGGKEDY